MKLIIIDGHAFVFRAYFAFQAANLTNSITGKPSGAVFGFFKMLFKIINDFKPTHIAMTFDPGTPLERSQVFEAYKAQRKPMPEDLKPQISEVIDITRELGFPVMQMAGHEADDIIGTLCKKFGNKKNDILIFSGDKDLYQTLNPNVKMYRGTKGATEFTEIDEKWVMENIGITPEQVVDYMGIVGDSSDNIPGVSGIGEKGAAKLIAEYKNLEGIYKSLEDIKNPSLKEKLIKNKENAFLSRNLATLRCDLEVDFKPDDLVLPKYLDADKIMHFKTRGYNRLYSDLAKQAGIKPTATPKTDDASSVTDDSIADTVNNAKGKYKRIQTEAELIKLVKDFQKSKLFCVDTETTSVDPMLAELLGIALSKEEGTGYYIPIAYSQSLFAGNCLSLDTVVNHIKPLLENTKIEKVGQNIKYDMIVLRNHGVEVENVTFDTMLASYCIQPGSRRHGMDDLALDYLEYKTITYEELVGTGKKKQELFNVDPDRVTEYAAEDADITLRLYHTLKNELKTSGAEDTFYKMEMPLMPVLMEMEMKGIAINAPYFKTLSNQFQKEIEKLEKRIHIHADKTFNIASTKELQKVLFEDLKLPAEKKTQTGYSTDHSVLESLLGMHPIIDDLLEHRKYTKLKSTYIDTLPALIHPKTKRIHTSYNQTIAATGRLSSTDPNLQNIPIKDEEGKLIRKGFIPENKDYLLLSLDYSQIELRIMAHFADDKNMIAAYQKNADIHNETAQALFGVSAKEVTPEMRNKAKIVNFSVIYGVTAYGLSQNLKVSRQEAGMFIDKYFYQFPGVKKYMEDICASCEVKGYVETITGRRRYIPEIKSSRRQEQEGGKRIAINSPIQGTSADMIKIAMLSIHDKLQKRKLKSKLIMQVHDELVFEVLKKEKDQVYELAKKEMESALKLKVPIIAQGNFGENWDEAH